MDDECRMEALDWLDGTIDELEDDLRRLKALKNRIDDGATLRRSDLDDIEAVGHNLERDVMSFKRRLRE